MTIVRQSVHINAPIERVWEFWVVGANAPKWHPAVRSARRLSGTANQKDSVMEYEVEAGGRRFRWITEVAEMVAPRRFVDVQREGPFKSYRFVGELSPEESGTRADLTVEYRLPYGLLGRIVDATRVRRDVEESTRKSVENLRRILESRA